MPTEGVIIVWPKELPIDMPPCGFSGELCTIAAGKVCVREASFVRVNIIYASKNGLKQGNFLEYFEIVINTELILTFYAGFKSTLV